MMSRRRLTARLHDFIQPGFFFFFPPKKEFLLCFSMTEVVIITHCPAPTWSESRFGLKKKRKEMEESKIKHKK